MLWYNGLVGACGHADCCHWSGQDLLKLNMLNPEWHHNLAEDNGGDQDGWSGESTEQGGSRPAARLFTLQTDDGLYKVVRDGLGSSNKRPPHLMTCLQVHDGAMKYWQHNDVSSAIKWSNIVFTELWLQCKHSKEMWCQSDKIST